MERVNKYLNKFTKVNSLNEKYVKVCQSPLTNNELHQVVNSLKKYKSPGSEGLTPEFYQVFWNKIEPLYENDEQNFLYGYILPDSTRK